MASGGGGKAEGLGLLFGERVQGERPHGIIRWAVQRRKPGSVFLQEDLESLKRVVEERIRYYNLVRKHSALGHLSPMAYLKKKGLEPRCDVSTN